MIQAAIFDLDGLLVNSEPLWRRAEAAVFGTLGISLTEAELAATTGIRLDEVVRIRYRLQPWSSLSLPEVENAILEELETLIRQEASATPGAEAAIAFFETREIPLAVASSSPLRVILAQLNRLGMLPAFKAICSAESEVLGKPYPGVYLRAAEALGQEARECLAFEDSLPGLIAAKAANMLAVAVPDPDHAMAAGFGIADCVLPTLEFWTDELWERMQRGDLPVKTPVG